MVTVERGRRYLRLVGLAMLALLVALTPVAPPGDDPYGFADPAEALPTYEVTSVGVAFTPPSIGTDADVPNPGRGQYQWLNVASAIPDLASTDVYWRDQLQWGAQIEKERGAYDFSAFDAGLAAAGANRSRFMFRIMAFCPGCGENLTPAYIPRQPDGTPDWNSEEFLEAWENLMSALGSRYDHDPRLGFIDVGGYGHWGEWYVPERSSSTPITMPNAARLIRAVVRAFPHKHVLMNYIDPFPRTAVAMSSKVGLRYDCIGGFPQTLKFLPDGMDQLWRRSPIVGEWCPHAETTASLGLRTVHDLHLSMLSSGNFPHPLDTLHPSERAAYAQAYHDSGFTYRLDRVTLTGQLAPGGRLRITSTWSNSGVAPTYDEWTPRLQLRTARDKVAWQFPLSVDLRAVTSDRGPRMTVDSADIPEGLRGVFAVTVVAEDPQGYLAPLRLANGQRRPGGGYWLGYLRLG